MQNKNSTKHNRVDRLFDAFSEQTFSDPVEARARVVAKGHDPDAITKHGMGLVERLKGRAELLIAKQQTIQRYQRAKQQLLERLNSIDDPVAYLLDLLSKRGQTALQVNFRNVNSLSNEELLDMIDEVELLYIFGELENDGPSEINE